MAILKNRYFLLRRKNVDGSFFYRPGTRHIETPKLYTLQTAKQFQSYASNQYGKNWEVVPVNVHPVYEPRPVTTFWCEWDIGINDYIFDTYECARRKVQEALSASGMDASLEDLEKQGLISFRIQVVQT